MEAVVAPLGRPELREQVGGVVVVAACSCGCPSVGLRADGPSLPADLRDVTAWATNAEGREVQVTAHVVLGRLAELEVWAGWDGGEVRTALPSPGSLRRWSTGSRAV